MKPGELVLSERGRDKNRYYIVMAVFDGTAAISNGTLRKSDAPKIKNVRHIKATGLKSKLIGKKLSEGQLVTNNMLKNEIKMLEGLLKSAGASGGVKEVESLG